MSGGFKWGEGFVVGVQGLCQGAPLACSPCGPTGCPGTWSVPTRGSTATACMNLLQRTRDTTECLKT